MSTGQTLQIESSSLENTLALAEQIGSRLRGGEVIELISDLGGGKTAFVRGLAKGMGSKDSVSSPSFTISNQYKSGGLVLHHYDFYRLNDPGIFQDELSELFTDPNAVVAVEWPDVVENVLPEERFTVSIQTTGESSRVLKFQYHDHLQYLLRGT